VSASFRVWQGGLRDAPLLAALHAGSFADAWPEPAFASLLARDEVIVLIGALSTEPEGFILLQTVADEAEVLTFCVAESVRRQGLGRALLDAACDVARKRGVAKLFLEVGSRNDAAASLYLSSGFVEVGRRAGYYHHGAEASDALVLRRVLN
jgi:ribosomal-protein-alanine N-acetyltransferase